GGGGGDGRANPGGRVEKRAGGAPAPTEAGGDAISFLLRAGIVFSAGVPHISKGPDPDTGVATGIGYHLVFGGGLFLVYPAADCALAAGAKRPCRSKSQGLAATVAHSEQPEWRCAGDAGHGRGRRALPDDGVGGSVPPPENRSRRCA